MKVTYTTANGRIQIEAEAASAKAAFEVVAGVQEVFEEPCCGLCKSTSIRFDVREFDKNKYYKLVCLACGGQFDFGQHKEGGGLFPKRRGEGKELLPNGGWYIYGQTDAEPIKKDPSLRDQAEIALKACKSRAEYLKVCQQISSDVAAGNLTEAERISLADVAKAVSANFPAPPSGKAGDKK